MKRKSILLFLFFTFFYLLSVHFQSKWFDQEAVWYYSTPYAFAHSDECTKVEIKGDTLIQGLTCKALLLKDVVTCLMDCILPKSYFPIIATRYINYWWLIISKYCDVIYKHKTNLYENKNSDYFFYVFVSCGFSKRIP